MQGQTIEIKESLALAVVKLLCGTAIVVTTIIAIQLLYSSKRRYDIIEKMQEGKQHGIQHGIKGPTVVDDE